MASVAPESGKGRGKRSLDASINLVPYVDLMTTIITFLLMTAIWTQIATLDVQNAASNNNTLDPNRPKAISVLLFPDGLQISEEGGQPIHVPSVNGKYDLSALKRQLEMLKQARPDRAEVNLKADDHVEYERIVDVIDVATGLGLSGVTLRPTAAS